MMFSAFAVIFISSALGALGGAPFLRLPGGGTFYDLERRLHDYSFEFRTELLSLMGRMELHSMEVCNISPGDFDDDTADDGEEMSRTEMSEPISEPLTAASNAEKECARRALLDLEQKALSQPDLSKNFENLEKGLRDEVNSMKLALNSEKDSCEKQLSDQAQSLADVFKKLDDINDGLRKEVAKMQNHIEAATASWAREIRDVKESLKMELSAEFSSIKTNLLNIRQEFERLTRKKCGSWYYYMDSCYFVSSEAVSWDDARDKCLSFDGYLAEVDNTEEADFLQGLAQNETSQGLGTWLGASDRDSEGTWLWSNSSRNVAYVYDGFLWPEPNGGGRENCLHLYRYGNFKWNDTPCDFDNIFICEK